MPKNPTCVPKNTCVIQKYVDPISYIALLLLKSCLALKKLKKNQEKKIKDEN